MAKKKFPYILIKDAKNGFRTQLIGGNGEPLMTSEVLETPKAVKINLLAVYRTGLSQMFNSCTSDKAIFETYVDSIDARYEGKSEAIYKLFKIVKQTK